MTLHQEWKDFDDWWEKYGPVTNPEAYINFAMICEFFNTVGLMVKTKIWDANLPYEQGAGAIISTWEKVEPIVKGYREKDLTYMISFEYLYNEIQTIREKQLAKVSN